MLYAASVGFPRQAAFVIKQQLIYSLSRCLIITVIWLPKLQLTHTHTACFAPAFAAQMHESPQELVQPPRRGNQTWREAGEAGVRLR